MASNPRRDPPWRPIRVTRLIDGDTVGADVRLDREIARLGDAIRVAGVNCPEIHSHDPAEVARGTAAAAFTGAWISQHSAHTVDPDWPLLARYAGADKYGRRLANISCDLGHDLGADLLSSGNAKPYDGRGPKPV